MTSPIDGATMIRVPCTHCGASVPGGTHACHRLLDSINDREYADPEFGAANLLTVDAYALQHVEDHGPKNIAFHLVRLAWALEFEGNPGIGQNPYWLQKLFDETDDLPTLDAPPPKQRGTMTIADVYGAPSASDHVGRVYDWAWAVWHAWEAHHVWARAWLTEHIPS